MPPLGAAPGKCMCFFNQNHRTSPNCIKLCSKFNSTRPFTNPKLKFAYVLPLKGYFLFCYFWSIFKPLYIVSQKPNKLCQNTRPQFRNQRYQKYPICYFSSAFLTFDFPLGVGWGNPCSQTRMRFEIWFLGFSGSPISERPFSRSTIQLNTSLVELTFEK